MAPYDDPEICVAVAVEGAYSGGSLSPVASAVYNYYYKNKVTTGENDDTQDDDSQQKEYSDLLNIWLLKKYKDGQRAGRG